MIFINFKTYEKGTGQAALKLVQVLEDVAEKKQIKIIPVLQSSDIKEATSFSKLEIWVQNIDPVEFGAHTGAILPEAVVEDGGMGTFLNHSEHKTDNYEDLVTAHQRAKSVGLKTLIFAADLKELEDILRIRPDFASYEPPELVGSKDTSVAQAKPEVVKDAVELAKKSSIPLIVGAGIKSKEDVETSIGLGASGIAVASDIVASENPKEELLELVEGFR